MSFNINMIQESFAKAKPAAMDIVERFYENLWEEHPEVKALFAATDMTSQKKALIRALTFVVDNLEAPDKLSAYLKSMGARHVNYGTRDEHYEWAGAALLKTFGEAFGRLWTAELADNWAKAYEAIAELMKEGAKLRIEAQPAATVIPLHNEDLKQAINLPLAVKNQIRSAVRTAVQEAIQREIQVALEEELGNLSHAGLSDLLLLRRQA